MQKILKSVICSFALTVMITGCTPVTAQRGNMLQEYQLQEVVIGESSRSDVLRLLGSPTTQSTFNNDVWYYIGQRTEKRGILDAAVVDENIIMVSFNNQGIVETIENVSEDRINIPYARDKTPTHGNELTFIQQLLGNVGRFNAPQGSPTDL